MNFVTRPLAYYQQLINNWDTHDRQINITISADECAAILQAHDYGINNATADAKEHLDILISKLKNEVWA